MEKWIAMLLAMAMVLALAACGDVNNGQNDDGQNNAQVDDSQNDNQQDNQGGDADDTVPGGEEPQIPDEGENGETEPEAPDGEEPAGEPEQEGMTLSRTDFTLFSAGSTYRLTVSGAEGTCTFSSSDEAVATVAEDGTVTAVAPGQATITVTCGEEKAACTVRCRWEESAGEEPETPDEQPAAGVDLNAFYEEISAQYEFSRLTAFEGEILESYYPGLSAIDTKQCLVMGTLISMNNGEFCLAEVSDSADVDAVKAIFQARVDGMINGGAWYPGPTEQWTNNSRVVSNGNFVMMVVHENCDDIVAAFNALFD